MRLRTTAALLLTTTAALLTTATAAHATTQPSTQRFNPDVPKWWGGHSWIVRPPHNTTTTIVQEYWRSACEGGAQVQVWASGKAKTSWSTPVIDTQFTVWHYVDMRAAVTRCGSRAGIYPSYMSLTADNWTDQDGGRHNAEAFSCYSVAECPTAHTTDFNNTSLRWDKVIPYNNNGTGKHVIGPRWRGHLWWTIDVNGHRFSNDFFLLPGSTMRVQS
jgi:hypothetical protein